MPAPCMSLAGHQREWKQTGKAAVQSPCIHPEEGKMKTPKRGTGMDVKSNQEHKQASDSPSTALSAQIGTHRRNGTPADAHTLRVDERLRLARERREEHLKQLASRERGRLAREERARRFYEKHLEERRKKLEEQRQREERRRTAVEEKRRQRLKEEQDRCESVVRRTIERSQKAKQRVGQASQRVLRSAKNNTNAKRRALSQWEINLISRLQTPTVSYLARSRSAACLSRGEVSCSSVSNSGPQKPRQNCATPTHNSVIRPMTINGSHQTSNRQLGSNNLEKRDHQKVIISQLGGVKVSSTTSADLQDKTVSSLTSTTLRQMSSNKDSLPPLDEEEDPVPRNLFSQKPQQDQSATLRFHGVECDGPVWQNRTSAGPLVPPAHTQTSNERCMTLSRPSAGTTDSEEASRLLLVKRRQARLEREREEEEHREREESERQGRREELSHQKGNPARQEPEALRLQPERWMRKEEEQRKAEEEEARRQEEKERKLQQQRIEEAQQRLTAEQQTAERESRFQRDETERQERKKRLEEIMKRTRKSEAAETEPASSSFIIKDALPIENIKPIRSLPLEGIVNKLPGPAKTSATGLPSGEDTLPVVAFKERRSIRTLTGLEEIQAHQRAEVI